MVQEGGYPTVLLVDDEESALAIGKACLSSHGIDNVLCCQDSREVPLILSQIEAGAILLDLSLPFLSGKDLLPILCETHPEVPVIIVTGAPDVETAVECMRMGAFDYLVKPVEKSRMVSAVRRALEIWELRKENLSLREMLLRGQRGRHKAFADIITRNPAMIALFQYAESAATTTKPVLITGETGVGKDLLAKALHVLSGRKGDLVTVNAGGVDDFSFSDTLFGHVRGAFTGADDNRRGLIEHSAGGTLFLDEVGDLSQPSQVKLLRLVQEREYFPLGSDRPKQSDARILVATNRDLPPLLEQGAFRKDLYYRLRTHHLHIPPLRERAEDVPLLLAHFMEVAAKSLGKHTPSYPSELLDLLGIYSFPGNIRELESMVFDAVTRHTTGRLSLAAFRNRIPHSGANRAQGSIDPGGAGSAFSSCKILPTIQRSTEMLVADALARTNGNQTLAAKMLGITQSALNKRIKRAETKSKN